MLMLVIAQALNVHNNINCADDKCITDTHPDTHQGLSSHLQQCVKLALIATQPGRKVAVKQQRRTLCM